MIFACVALIGCLGNSVFAARIDWGGGEETPAVIHIQSPAPVPQATQSKSVDSPLLNPALASERAPSDVFRVQFVTTKGYFTVLVNRSWAPKGVDRFYNLVKSGFYDNTPFYRIIDGYIVQFGVNSDPKANNAWIWDWSTDSAPANIPDDPRNESSQHNKRGYVSFALGGPNTRATVVFVNYADNSSKLDHLEIPGSKTSMDFMPVGVVTEGALPDGTWVKDGMMIVDALYKGYGRGFTEPSCNIPCDKSAPPSCTPKVCASPEQCSAGCQGPDQITLFKEGREYMQKFPKLDYIQHVGICGVNADC